VASCDVVRELQVRLTKLFAPDIGPQVGAPSAAEMSADPRDALENSADPLG
jgi:hypothetical protein